MQLYKSQGFLKKWFICHKNMIIDVRGCDWKFKDVLEKALFVFIKNVCYTTICSHE